MEAIKHKIIEFLLRKYALGYLIKLWQCMQGYRTQVFSALTVVIWALEFGGYLEPGSTEKFGTLTGTLAVTGFLSKLNRYRPMLEEIKKGGVQK